MQQLAEPAKFLRGKLPGLYRVGLMYRELGVSTRWWKTSCWPSLDTCVLEGEASLPRDGAGLAASADASAAVGPSTPNARRA